jgi:hypothetical protein
MCVSTLAFAQADPDSLGYKLEHVTDKAQIDSLNQKLRAVTDKLDSAELKLASASTLPQLPDSLLPSFHKVDSIRNKFNTQADSLRNQYEQAIAKIDGPAQKLTGKIDSLQSLSLPTGKYTKKLDSLNQLRQDTQARFTSKLDALKSKTNGKLHELDLPSQYKEPLQQLTKNVDGLNLNTDVLKVPALNIPGYSLPNIDDIGDLASKAGDLGKIGDLGDLPILDNTLGNLPEVETPVGDLGHVTEQAKAYQDDIKNISQGNLNDVKELPKTIEEQAAKIDGVQELQKQSGVMEEYKDKLDVIKDPNAMKEKGVEMAKEAAVDHFAGKQEQLKAAMEKMAKYKKKYSSVSSLKDLPKRPPNAMKGKPFMERVVPGVYFQYQQKTYNLFDLNPYIGYRISGRFTSGAGWNHRYGYDRRTHLWSSRAKIYGPRAYVDFKLGKGFIAHLETEVMNTFVPSALNGNPDTGQREWVWGMMTGMKKEYKIYGNLRGTVLLQYNLFNPKYKAPYVDRLNSRIGFEYSLKKKIKKPKGNQSITN